MYSANVLALGKAALQGTETEQRIALLLYDDNFQVISTFELNQIASLTYHEGSIVGELDLTDKILEHLHTILSKPVDYSPLSIEKALVVTKQVLIFGASKVLQPVRVSLGRQIDALQQYNTALIAQQQTGAAGLFIRLKGGSVDKGGTVRELATTITRFIQNDSILQFERNTQADPNSLVPVGDRKKVSFISDEARLRYLKRQIEHQKLLEQRSNLAKANDGFGAGYMSRDGKTVVGAAHGIDEMIKQAQRAQNKFSEDGQAIKAPDIDVDELRQYAKEFEQQYGYSNSSTTQQNNHFDQPETDLLALDDLPVPKPQQQYQSDLLSMGGHVGGGIYNYQQQQTTADLLDFGATGTVAPPVAGAAKTSSLLDADFYGPSSTGPAQSSSINTTADLLSVMSLSGEPQNSSVGGLYALPSVSLQTPTSDPFAPPVSSVASQQPAKKSIMGGLSSSDDRFAALDILGSSSTSSTLGQSNVGVPAPTGLGSSSLDVFSGLGATTTSNGLVGLNNPVSSNPLGSGIGLPTNGQYGGISSASTILPKSSFGSTGSNLMYSPSSSLNNKSTDVFSGLTGLGGMTNLVPNTTGSIGSTFGGSMMMSSPPPIEPVRVPNLSSIQVSAGYVAGSVDEDEIASGFVMGGTVGSGLIPTAPVPDIPPPPPPPATPW